MQQLYRRVHPSVNLRSTVKRYKFDQKMKKFLALNLFSPVLKSVPYSVSGILLVSGVVISGGLQAPANALTTIPCPSDPSNTHVICGVRGAVFEGKVYDIDLFSGLAEDLYGVNGEHLTVTSQAQAEGLMAASAAALNAFAITQPFNPTKPPILFGDAALIDFKIAWELDLITIPGERVWNASRSRWEKLPDRWEIVPVPVPWPADVPNVWADVREVPGPLPLLGIGAVFGYSRKIRKRNKSSRPEVITDVSA
jgi:hypothetical protein